VAFAGGLVSGNLATAGTTQTGKVTQAKTSVCGIARTAAVAADSQSFKYLSWTFVNSLGADACFTFDYLSTNNTNIGVAAYLGSFNPSNVTSNFLGGYDLAASCAGKSGSLSVLVPTGQTVVLVVSECSAGIGGQFQFTVGAQTASYQPDGRIRKGTGALVGNDLYNSDATNQSIDAVKRRGRTVTFTLSLQDDGNAAGKYDITTTGPATAGFSIKYFRGTTDITSRVNAGTYDTGVILPGGTWDITVTVKVLKSAAMGSSISRLVTFASAANGYQYDAVQLTVHRK